MTRGYERTGKQVFHVEGDTRTHIADAANEDAAHAITVFMNVPTGDDGGPMPPRFDYMAACDKTNSTIFRPEQVEIQDMRHVLMAFSGFANDMNMIKKLLVRGKTREELGFPPIPKAEATLASIRFKPNEVDIIHGLIGIVTEAGEVADILLRITAGETVDNINVLEECGDLRWYIVRALRGIGATDDLCEHINIDKLRGRHGETFNMERDANRDLAAEREKLEAAAPLFDPPPSYGDCEGDNPANPPAPGMTWHDGCWRREIVRDVPGLAV